MKNNTHSILMTGLVGLFLPMFFLSCNDDEDFTTEAGASLVFSQDTITFDTIFTNVTSPTKRFQVYNKNDKGLRITNVSLESNGTSGFMLNVDGQNGTEITNVQVLHKDSIFVFVKVNMPATSSMKPAKMEDAIIFTLENGARQKVVLEAWGQDWEEMNDKVLKGDYVFTEEELPHVVYDSLVVASDASLTLKEGTTLYFHNGARLIVHGTLKIEGSIDKPVVLRGDRLDWMFDYLPYDRLENQWGGIYLSPSCKGCDINYADIHSGNYGIISDGIEGKVTITNSIIHNTAGYGLYLKDCESLVANTQISNSQNDCVSIYGGTANFYHCTLAQFYPWNAEHGNALFVSNYIDEELHLVQAVNFYNCFVTGYADDEVFGQPGDKTLNLHFYNCALLTDVSDESYFHNCVGEKKEAEKYKDTNFRTFDTHAFIYDFRLDAASVARGIASTAYSKSYPTDKLGITRGEKPDAGCYQYTE